MKRIIALLAALVLCMTAAAACAEGDWYLETAQRLHERLDVLVQNETFLSFFMDPKEDGVAEELEMMAETIGLEPVRTVRLRYAPEKVDAYMESYFVADRVDDNTRLVQAELLRRMNPALPEMLNGVIGGALWTSLSLAFQTAESCAVPDSFEEGALALDFGLDTAVLVTFTQSGEDIVTAEASYIRTESLDSELTEPYLNLLWEKE